MFFKPVPKYLEKVSYTIDAYNTIVSYGDDWVKSAITGNAWDLIDDEKVVGVNILDYILGENVRAYYYSLFESCRLFNTTKILEYRCDSSTHKRYMEMHVIPRAHNTLLINNYLLKEEPFNIGFTIIDQTNTSFETDMLRCSVCNRLRFIGEKHWLSPEYFIIRENQTLNVIHSLCSNCRGH